ncbi:MAG: adenylate/guanylate cyclase domain-containing protein [Bacteroidales bacterium]|nr:adenylate/guanylate cyclase domain-containing protein [Bacteroidales bacterium]
MQERPKFRGQDPYTAHFIIALFLLIALLMPGQLAAQDALPDTIASLWIKYNHSHDDSSRVVYLSRLAFFYNDYLEDYDKADSLAEAAIRVAEKANRPVLQIIAYNNYLESTDNAIYYTKCIEYAGKALLICRKSNILDLRWRTYRNLAGAYLSRNNYTMAMSSSKSAQGMAKILKNDTMIAESYLYIGESHEVIKRKIEAYTYYLRAREMAEMIEAPALLIKCYSRLFKFYDENKLFNDAIESKQKECEIIETIKPVDSVALLWTHLYVQYIKVRQKTIELDENSVKNIIDFSIRKRIKRLKFWEFSLYRLYLLETDQLKTLCKFYKQSYPDEFERLKVTNPDIYFRIMAYFKELEKLPDSADYYFNKAQQILSRDPGIVKIYLSNFYNRYGQFLMRHGRNKEAIEKFSRSYNIGTADVLFERFEYILTAATHLEKLYQEVGDYKNAWYYAVASIRINDSINLNSKKDQLMNESLKRERVQKENAAEQDRQKIRQGKNQRNIMTGIVGFFIIVSLLVYRNYRNQKRSNKLLDAAKKQSDHLLLNILPHETAEELKLTGKAKAKRFDEVTVMFTDFKDFTQASELMSAEELVDEINVYFSEFDHIISRHNIEKIKIIGDSYMCAGGLPVVNKTHAYDVVAAALEFQKFMIAMKVERQGLGKSFFELRIGIHTGPVVAGIVGLKKFAYDIWGDTVNTASRMENAGAPNKVNISGATFEKVKDRFSCTYRGKVPAKHKGEVDMYFVGTENV